MSEVADAINASDAPGTNSHISSVAISAILEEAGYSAIYQISCRDRNRIAIRGDMLGAAALGVKNILCLTGDSVGIGDQPKAKPVFDLDSISLLKMPKTMHDDGKFLSGRNITHPPKYLLERSKILMCRLTT
jgi:methylenetetrahydrofolate reductase (NADPH)